LPPFWSAEAETIKVFQDGKPLLLSLDTLTAMPSVATLMKASQFGVHIQKVPRVEDPVATCGIAMPVILYSDLEDISNPHRKAIFENRRVAHVSWLQEDHLAIEWILTDNKSTRFISAKMDPIELTEMQDPYAIGFCAHKTTDDVYGCLILNQTNPYVQWLTNVDRACSESRNGLTKEQFSHLLKLFLNPVRYTGHELQKLMDYLAAWKEIPGLSADLCPPDLQMSHAMFTFRHGRHKKEDVETSG
jgi:hypothetical protein